VRLVAAFVVRFVVACIALALASLLLDGFSIHTIAFPLVALVFTVIMMIARAVLDSVLDKHAQWAASFVGLGAAFVALVLTNAFSDHLTISGASTWLWASLIIWLGGILAELLVGRALVRRIAGPERARGR